MFRASNACPKDGCAGSAPSRYFPWSQAAQRLSQVRLLFVDGSGLHRVPHITVGLWLLCRLLTSVQSRHALPHSALCIRIRVRWWFHGFRHGPQSDSHRHTPLVEQISPDKSMNCHDTTAGFTAQREFVVFVVMCQLDPAARPCIRFLFVGSSFCT